MTHVDSTRCPRCQGLLIPTIVFDLLDTLPSPTTRFRQARRCPICGYYAHEPVPLVHEEVSHAA